MDAALNSPDQRPIPLSKNEIAPGALCLAPFPDGGKIVYYRGRIRAVEFTKAWVTRSNPIIISLSLLDLGTI